MRNWCRTWVNKTSRPSIAICRRAFVPPMSGVGRERIDILGKSGGIAYAQGSPISSLPPNTVKLGVGL